ncbi:DUF4340 domain-containing protein [Bacteroidota bacterium]
MFKKLNTRTLGIAFIVLLVIVVLLTVSDRKKGERTFKSVLVEFKEDEISSIEIVNRNDLENKLVFKKSTDENWRIKKGNEEYNADTKRVENLITELLRIEPERVAATKKEGWKEFEVTDSLATRVVMFDDNKPVSDIYIGKFSYQNPTNPYERQGKMTSYVRLKGDNNVYAVNGFLRMTFSSDIVSYRNRMVINANEDDLTRLSFNYPADSSFTLIKDGGKWMIDGVLADSAKVEEYLGSISNLSSSQFSGDSVLASSNATHNLQIESNNMVLIEVKALPATSDDEYLLTSTLNPGTYYSGSGADLFEKVYKGKGYFLNSKQ